MTTHRIAPLCIECAHDFALHIVLGPATGAFKCRADACGCRAYVARTAAVRRARVVAA